ncbi:RNA polymerase II-associated 1 [Brachionus plicatilis]|uniref:RNA polymerase II-associated 1 n=1 Tax=Brachionus plicatilis TaxID=10195 RepID=A0A3M7Q7P2_BRAPC|nr:RNA polymerase II-associated 1 [Brachionus plicatilis]
MSVNLKRPKGIGEEDEDELFKFQEEFLRQKSLQPSAKVVKLTNKVQVGEEKPRPKLDFESDNQAFSAVLSDIVEKPTLKEFSDTRPKSCNQLPKIEKLNLKELNQHGSGNKKSLFAQNLERQGRLKSFFDLNQVVQPSSLREDEKIKLVEKQITQEKTVRTQIISGQGLTSKKDAEQIHLENLELLSKMKPEEILAEKNKLMQQLDPKIIAFIKKKSNQSPFGFRSEADKPQTSERPSDQDILEQLHIKPNKKWLHMDKIEYDKLEWMLKPRNVAKTEGSKSARFDFEGNLVAPEEEVPTIRALHHHGSEPDLAGYTLDELFHLARSKFNQQRVLALQTLGNILKRCHFGDYHEVIKSADDTQEQENDQNNLLNQLVEGGILFLLRWNLDDQTESIIIASLEAIDNLLHHAEQEDVLDYTFDLYDGHESPCLHPFSSIFADNKPKLSLDKNLNVAEEKDLEELKDDEFVRVDLIRGLFRMNLMERLFYLLNLYQPLNQVKVEEKIFSILFRCVRHSPQISFELIEKHSSLVDLMAKKFLPTFIDQNACDVPSLLPNSTKTVKLLRLLSNTGPTLAFNLYKKFNLKVKIVNYLTLEKYLTEPNWADLAIGLETETVRLLKTLIVYSHKEMGYECVIDFYEVLIEKLKNLMAHVGEENWKKVSLMQSIVSLFGLVLKSATEPNLNFVSEISAAVYSLVASFVQKKFASLFNNQIDQVTENINFNLYSTCLNYLVDYLEKMELLTSFEKPADLSSRKRMYVEILIDSLVEPLVCKKYAINQLKLEQLVLSKLGTFSVYSQGPVREKFGKIFSNNLSYLPTICHISKIDQCDVIRQSPFGFLAAFIRLYNLCFINRINVIDDSKFSNTKSLLINSYINSYLKYFVENNDQSLGSPLRSFYPAKFENWFVFNFLKTAFNLFNFEEEENDQADEIMSSLEKYTDQEINESRNQKRFFYLVSLSLLVKFRKGEESLIFEVLSLFTFNLNFWSLYIDNKKTVSSGPADKSFNSLIQYFSKLDLNNSLPQIKFSHININFAQSETILINRSFIENMESTHIYDLLNQIKFSYLQNQTLLECRLLDHSKNLKKINNSHLNTLFLSTDYSNQFLLRPDWIYAPILSEKAEFSKISMLKDKEKDNQIQKTISNLSNSLKFIYLLESYFDKDYLEKNLNSTLRYIKLLFVYLFDPEVFLEKQIITIMYLIFFKYVQDRKQPLSNLNFDQKFSDIISFYDFYQHLLNQYDSSSFGDYLFAQYLVVPLQQCYPVKYRQLFWSDFHYLFKYMKFNDESSKMLIPLRKFVQPNEKYLNMIRLYSQLMLDPNDFKLVSESTLGYAILVASLNSFIFEHINKFENKVEFDFKKLLATNFMKLNEKIRKDLFYYKDIHETIEHYEQLPDIRKQWLDQLMS